MALYEGLSAEKLAVVLDIGARYTKFGFVGEFSPRCIIPTEIYCTRSEKIRKIFDYENDQDLYALLVAFLHKLYFRHVLVSPKDRHVVVVESLLCPTQFRDTLASVFYRHYEIKNITMNCWLPFALLLMPLLCAGFEVGYTASMVNWPFVGGIYYKEGSHHNRRPFCSGTIILDTFVLTTVGCLNRPNPEAPEKPLYLDIIYISVWVGSSFGFVPTSENVEAQMVDMKNYYFPQQEDLDKAFGKLSPISNNYTVEGFTYYYLDFCLLETNRKIVYNNYVHAVPFDVRNTATAMEVWNTTLREFEESLIPVPDCFTAGWGSYMYGNETWRLYRLRYVKARFTERIHCMIAYCGNCSLCYLRMFNESTYGCFSMYMTGDTCLEDEGAPLFCPWYGYKNDEDLGWGALLGHMSGRMGNCRKTELPSMFNLIWTAYPFISRVTQIAWPPPGHQWIIPRHEGDDDYEQELQ